MRCFLAVVLCALWQSSSGAATFVGEVPARFVITEALDGTVSSAAQTGTVGITLNTDYTSLRWSLQFDVDLLLIGGPDEAFERRFTARGEFGPSRRFVPSESSTEGEGQPSAVTFPDALGGVGAGTFIMFGQAEWELSDRIGTAVHERSSERRSLRIGSQYIGPTTHSLSVGNYPSSIQLGAKIGGIGFPSIVDGVHQFEASMSVMESPITLRELLPGDYDGNGSVDASDYVLWRDLPGVLAPFLTSYDMWQNNFGSQLSARAAVPGAATVPEPVSLVLLLLAISLLATTRKRGLSSSFSPHSRRLAAARISL